MTCYLVLIEHKVKMPELTIQCRYHYQFEDHLEDAVQGSDLQGGVRVSLLAWH